MKACDGGERHGRLAQTVGEVGRGAPLLRPIGHQGTLVRSTQGIVASLRRL